MNMITDDSVIQELNALKEELTSAGQRGFSAALRMGEILTGKRAEIPARKGWGEFLKTVQIDHNSDNRYRNLWKYRPIFLTVRNIGLTEAYAMISAEKRKTRPPTTVKTTAVKKLKIKVAQPNYQEFSVSECSTPGFFVVRLYLDKVERKVFDLATDPQATDAESETAWTKLKILIRKRKNKTNKIAA